MMTISTHIAVEASSPLSGAELALRIGKLRWCGLEDEARATPALLASLREQFAGQEYCVLAVTPNDTD